MPPSKPGIKLMECPRDAMQGLLNFVPTPTKANYINLLLKAGFDTIDFGSFVSPKAVPQMEDTDIVLALLDMSNTRTKLLAVVANYRGAEEAVQYPEISFIGYPFSLSETFQKRNTNSTIKQSFDLVKKIQALCDKKSKTLVIYLSMGFGNPYGDVWNTELVLKWVQKLTKEGIKIVSMADTIGMATADQISELYPLLTQTFPETEFGMHLHSRPDTCLEKIDAAFQSGCRRIDSTIKGYGGCPFAKDDLTGNIATETLLGYLKKQRVNTGIDMDRFADAMVYSSRIFG
jgi:hydroxymethylglutaryl-CoA lyase